MEETSPPASAEPPKKPQKKHYKKPKKPEKPEKREIFNDILPELHERYPKAFTRDPQAIMPLAIGLHKELIQAGYDRKALYKAIKYYTNSYAYLGALAAGKPRVNLDGEPVGTVSEEHQQEAAAALATPGGRKPKAPPDGPPPVVLAGRIDKPTPKTQNQQKTPMPSIDLKGLQAKIAVTIDAATFRAALKVDTMGAKSVPVTIVVEGKAYTAGLNPKSFRKAQAMFEEAAQPVVSISGNLKGDVIEAAGIQVFDKGGKAPASKAATPAPEAATPAAEPAKAPETEPAAPETGAGGRPKLSLKPKAG